MAKPKDFPFPDSTIWPIDPFAAVDGTPTPNCAYGIGGVGLGLEEIRTTNL